MFAFVHVCSRLLAFACVFASAFACVCRRLSAFVLRLLAFAYAPLCCAPLCVTLTPLALSEDPCESFRRTQLKVPRAWFNISGTKAGANLETPRKHAQSKFRISWWTFRPRKKIFSPPPPQIPQFGADNVPAPRPLLETPLPSWEFSKQNGSPPLLAPRTPPSPSPSRKKLKISETSTKISRFCTVGDPPPQTWKIKHILSTEDRDSFAGHGQDRQIDQNQCSYRSL